MAAAVPNKTQVLVIGGGPAGSYTASCLVREGVEVTLLEADKFPRYHIGESTLASMRPLLRFIDGEKKFIDHGFTVKIGGAFRLNKKNIGYTDFLAGGPDNYSWTLERSESDQLLFEHARSLGAKCFDEHKVTSISFDEKTSRPISADWTNKSGAKGSISFDYLVDASGRVGILSTKYLKTRTYNQGLKNVASWGYWTGCAKNYEQGTVRENVPFLESLQDESGWAWYFKLHTGYHSVGIVQNQEIVTKKKRERIAAGNPNAGNAKEFYLEELKEAPEILELIGKNAKLANNAEGEGSNIEVKNASDYSYQASSYAGPGYRIVGDAGAFIDPYFSSGIHLAMMGALTAAASVNASIKGDCSEEDAGKWHSERVGMAYTRFLIVVLSAYKQIRQQNEPVLSDLDEDNFDRAFSFFRPVIQGTADVGEKLTKEELAQTIDFCSKAFIEHKNEQLGPIFAKVKAIKEVEAQAQASGTSVEQAMRDRDLKLTDEEQVVLNHINARRALHAPESIGTSDFTSDVVNGMKLRMTTGNLGLDRVNEKKAAEQWAMPLVV